MDFLDFNKALCLSEQLASKDTDTGGSVADFIVLGLRNVHQDLGSRVLCVNGFQDSCTVIGNNRLSGTRSILSGASQDFVLWLADIYHALGT